MDWFTFIFFLFVVVQFVSFTPTLSDKKATGHEITDEEQNNEIRPVVIGGSNDTDVQVNYNGKWINLDQPLPLQRDSMGAANLDNFLYVAGGYIEYVPTKTVLKRSIQGVWTLHSNLKEERSFAPLTAVNTGSLTGLMITGGMSKFYGPMITTEIYTPQTGWVSDPNWNMNKYRYMHAAVMLKGKLHVLGGHGDEWATWKSTEVFDFSSRKWSAGPDLNIARECHAATVVDDVIYTCGGYRGLRPPEYLQSCEKGDEHGFVRIEDMKVLRAYFGMVTIGREVWAIGGNHRDEYVEDSVEKYNVDHKMWTLDRTRLKPKRTLFGVVTISINQSTGRRLELSDKIVNDSILQPFTEK